jgi:hypothetical protein
LQEEVADLEDLLDEFTEKLVWEAALTVPVHQERKTEAALTMPIREGRKREEENEEGGAGKRPAFLKFITKTNQDTEDPFSQNALQESSQVMSSPLEGLGI